MNTYHFIYQSYTIHIKAATLGQAYEILSRENVANELKLMSVECKRGQALGQIPKDYAEPHQKPII